jgi:hypothetical protein
MNKNFLLVGVLVLLLASCGPTKEEYDKAAETVCECMSKEAEGDEASDDDSIESSLDEAFLAFDYALCMLDVAMDVDVSADELTASMEDKCPDMADTHAEYVKGL